jgi:hypothetical protein
VLGLSPVDSPCDAGVVETPEVIAVRLPVTYVEMSPVLAGVEPVDIVVVSPSDVVEGVLLTLDEDEVVVSPVGDVL